MIICGATVGCVLPDSVRDAIGRLPSGSSLTGLLGLRTPAANASAVMRGELRGREAVGDVADRLGAYVWKTLRKLDVIPPAPAAPNEERNAGEDESADGCCEAESCCASGEGDEGEYEPERSAAMPDAPGTRDA